VVAAVVVVVVREFVKHGGLQAIKVASRSRFTVISDWLAYRSAARDIAVFQL
jgi:hypothetical protein